ncbi:MBL fold metallo-hydrolase [Streptacidiphilus albus]|uniref:MBL fold metallo-hydrolase n=1 Tax=Streptacidiphilus albus TaxID=105425 RepID=UPI0034E1E724
MRSPARRCVGGPGRGAVPARRIIEGSDGRRVVHTPGHSPGHLVLVHEPSRTALLGDAVVQRGEPAIGPAGRLSLSGA